MTREIPSEPTLGRARACPGPLRWCSSTRGGGPWVHLGSLILFPFGDLLLPALARSAGGETALRSFDLCSFIVPVLRYSILPRSAAASCFALLVSRSRRHLHSFSCFRRAPSTPTLFKTAHSIRLGPSSTPGCSTRLFLTSWRDPLPCLLEIYHLGGSLETPTTIIVIDDAQ